MPVDQAEAQGPYRMERVGWLRDLYDGWNKKDGQ